MKALKIFIAGILAIFMLQSCIVSQHPNMSFFDNPYYDYKDAKFTSVNVPMFIAKPFIKKALKEDGEDNQEIIALIKKVKKVKVLTVENGDKNMLSDFSKYLTQNNYQDWMTVKHDGQNVNIQAKQTGEKIKRLMLTVNADKQLVFIDVAGNFIPDDISRIINAAQKSNSVSKK